MSLDARILEAEMISASKRKRPSKSNDTRLLNPHTSHPFLSPDAQRSKRSTKGVINTRSYNAVRYKLQDFGPTPPPGFRSSHARTTATPSLPPRFPHFKRLQLFHIVLSLVFRASCFFPSMQTLTSIKNGLIRRFRSRRAGYQTNTRSRTSRPPSRGRRRRRAQPTCHPPTRRCSGAQ